MARPRKAPNELVDRRQSRMASRIVGLPSVKIEEPPHPKSWLVGASDAWGKFWKSDLATAVNDADLPTLTHLFELYDERNRLLNAYKKKRVVEGSKGQVRVNPCLAQALSMDKEISVLEMRFGITPLGRSRLGLQFGREKQTLDELNQEMNRENREASDEDPRTLDIGEVRST